tara:strand:- start:3111 stop:3788 length:678 start_codon:yes stop_codon:yes gene_type:complete
MRRYDLREIPFYYINLDDAVERNENMKRILNELGIKNVRRISATRHNIGQAGTARSMLEAIETAINPVVSPLGAPFVVLEDDIEVKRWDPIIEVPENADALYLGISGWGRMNGHSGPFVQSDSIGGGLLQVYNMLGGHAIMYFRDRYIDLVRRVCLHAGYDIEDHPDIGFAEIQRWHNVYAFDDPYFYQTSSGGNQRVTYIPLSQQESSECLALIPQLYLPLKVI